VAGSAAPVDRAPLNPAATDVAGLAEDRITLSIDTTISSTPDSHAAGFPAAGRWPPRMPADTVARPGEPGRPWPAPLRPLIARR
jgi:hypothetical protein